MSKDSTTSIEHALVRIGGVVHQSRPRRAIDPASRVMTAITETNAEPSAVNLTILANAPMPARPDALTASVMLRVRGVAASGVTERRAMLEGRFSRTVLAAGAAVAAAVVIAVLIWPTAHVDDISPIAESTSAHAPDVKFGGSAHRAAASAPLNAPSGQIRYIREVGGRRLYLTSAGAIQGTRVGDRLEWSRATAGDWGVSGSLRVVGVAPFHSFVELVTDRTEQPTVGDWLALPAEAFGAAIAANPGTRVTVQPDGMLLGVGVLLGEEAQLNGKPAVVVREVIPAYWYPENVEPVVTRGAAAGVARGDVVIALMGEPVSSVADIGRIIGRHSLSDAAFEMEVVRGDEVLRLIAPLRAPKLTAVE